MLERVQTEKKETGKEVQGQQQANSVQLQQPEADISVQLFHEPILGPFNGDPHPMARPEHC